MKGGVWLLLYSAFFNEVFVAIILLYPPREIGLGLVIQNLSVRAHGPLIPPPKITPSSEYGPCLYFRFCSNLKDSTVFGVGLDLWAVLGGQMSIFPPFDTPHKAVLYPQITPTKINWGGLGPTHTCASP